MLDVLGGMGPQPTADFLLKLVKHTDAETDVCNVTALARSCVRFFGSWTGRPAAGRPTLAIPMAL
jgi:aspartate/glutamate racemase